MADVLLRVEDYYRLIAICSTAQLDSDIGANNHILPRPFGHGGRKVAIPHVYGDKLTLNICAQHTLCVIIFESRNISVFR